MYCGAVPVVGGRLMSAYGMRPGGMHTGIDIAAPDGTPVRTILPGRVVVVAPTGQLELYGNTVVLKHDTSLFSLWAHLQSFSVSPNEVLDQGAELGRVGRTAGTRAEPWRVFAGSNSHLHLEFLDRWPPRGRDVDRLDIGQLLGELGIIVPASGPLQSVCQHAPSEGVSYASTSTSSGSSSSSSSGWLGGGLGVALLAYGLHRLLELERGGRGRGLFGGRFP